MGRPLLAHSCPSIGRLASIRPTGSRWAIPDPKRSFVRARKSRLLPIRFQGRAAAAQQYIEYDSKPEDGSRSYSPHFSFAAGHSAVSRQSKLEYSPLG